MSHFKIKKAQKKRRPMGDGRAIQLIRRERSFPASFKARTPDHHHRRIAAAIPNQQTLDAFLSQLKEGPERDTAFEVLKPLLRFPAVDRISAPKIDHTQSDENVVASESGADQV